MPADHYDRVLTEFGLRCGLAGLRFDTAGVCPLSIPDHLMLALRHDRRRDRLAIMAGAAGDAPARLDAERLAALAATVLDALAGDDLLIGWHPSAELWLAYRELPEPASGAQLEEQVAQFVEWYQAWRSGPDFPLPPPFLPPNGDHYAHYV